MRILVLAADNPSPPINGTRIRNFHLWPELRKLGHEVKVLAITRQESDQEMNSEEMEFHTFTRKGIFRRIWMRLFHSYHEWPVSDSLEKSVKEHLESWKPDVIHAEELRMGRYLPEISSETRSVHTLCVHNVESDLIQKTLAAPFPFAVRLFNAIYRFNLLRFERKVFSRAHTVLAYSELDRKRYESLYPEASFGLSSNGTKVINLAEAEKRLPKGENLLFLGSLSYLPNIEGLFWLLNEVFPKLSRPVRLRVAGSTPAEVVRERLRRENIELIDTPLDLAPVYFASSALLVPILSGSGTRGKILEAFMYNRAVITTSKGIEGLHFATGEGAILADSAATFAKAIDEWVEAPDMDRQDLADKGRSAVVEKYTWKHVGEKLLVDWELARARLPQTRKTAEGSAAAAAHP